jgi:hypothetical protein
MSPIWLLLLACALPTAAGYLLIAAVRGGLLATERLGSRRRGAAPEPEPQDRLAGRLRRLRTELEAAEDRPGMGAKHHHVTALRGAYLDNLHEACARLGVPPPAGGDRAAQAEIYRVEAALRARGLDVRVPAGR